MALGPQLTALLNRYGLGSLAGWASEAIVSGLGAEEIEFQLRERPEFKARFPAITAREKAGLPPVSVDEYLAYEQSLSQMGRAFGVTLTKAQTDAALGANVSVAEMQERVGIAATAVYQSPPEVRAALSRLYGIGTGDLVNYWLDPKQTAPVLQRKFVAAQIAAEAERVGFAAQLSAEQAESLGEAGVTADAARGGFGQLVEAAELFEAVDETEQDIGVDDQLSLLTGNVDLARQVERRGERRAARFQEGGGFATGRQGVGGLGSAAR